MNGYRKMMIYSQENLGWCKPYISEDGKNAITVNEGAVNGMMIDGADMDLDFDIAKFARAVNPDYDDYDGWDDLHIALDGDVHEQSCARCPWFDICEAMDNPDGWEDTPQAGQYPDD